MSHRIELQLQVLDLYSRYARAIDDARFDDWLSLFDAQCAYHVIPLENSRRQMELPIIRCRNRAMLSDRIVSLQQANIYNIHTDRHFISNIQVLDAGEHGVQAEADFVIYQTDQEGETRLFCVGRYRTWMVGAPDQLRIREQRVTLDTASVPTLIATPL